MSLERRGHAESDSFDRKVRQGRRDKTFRSTAGTEAKDIPQGESRVGWKRWSSRLLVCESAPSAIGRYRFKVKGSGKPDDRKDHVRFGAAHRAADPGGESPLSASS